jgi:hypothetical protein
MTVLDQLLIAAVVLWPARAPGRNHQARPGRSG